MKKKLEAELISIAHRVLRLKNREDVIQLHLEAQKLYEKLSILRFYEENLITLQSELPHEQLESKLNQAYGPIAECLLEAKLEKNDVIPAKDIQNEVQTSVTIPEEISVEEEKILVGLIALDEKEVEESESVITEESSEIQTEEEDEPIVANVAATQETLLEPESHVFEPALEPITEVFEEKKAAQQISFEDLLGDSYKEPDFVKVNEVANEVVKSSEIVFEKTGDEVVTTTEKIAVLVEEKLTARPLETIKREIESEKAEYKASTLNDTFNKTIALTLNDRIAFAKHLFSGSGEDLNRVLSQLNTLNSLDEAKNFIEDLVKPDYNNWEGKDEYSSRFMDLVEKKFV